MERIYYDSIPAIPHFRRDPLPSLVFWEDCHLEGVLLYGVRLALKKLTRSFSVIHERERNQSCDQPHGVSMIISTITVFSIPVKDLPSVSYSIIGFLSYI